MSEPQVVEAAKPCAGRPLNEAEFLVSLQDAQPDWDDAKLARVAALERELKMLIDERAANLSCLIERTVKLHKQIQNDVREIQAQDKEEDRLVTESKVRTELADRELLRQPGYEAFKKAREDDYKERASAIDQPLTLADWPQVPALRKLADWVDVVRLTPRDVEGILELRKEHSAAAKDREAIFDEWNRREEAREGAEYPNRASEPSKKAAPSGADDEAQPRTLVSPAVADGLTALLDLADEGRELAWVVAGEPVSDYCLEKTADARELLLVAALLLEAVRGRNPEAAAPGAGGKPAKSRGRPAVCGAVGPPATDRELRFVYSLLLLARACVGGGGGETVDVALQRLAKSPVFCKRHLTPSLVQHSPVYLACVDLRAAARRSEFRAFFCQGTLVAVEQVSEASCAPSPPAEDATKREIQRFCAALAAPAARLAPHFAADIVVTGGGGGPENLSSTLAWLHPLSCELPARLEWADLCAQMQKVRAGRAPVPVLWALAAPGVPQPEPPVADAVYNFLLTEREQLHRREAYFAPQNCPAELVGRYEALAETMCAPPDAADESAAPAGKKSGAPSITGAVTGAASAVVAFFGGGYSSAAKES
ncbi:hypothetical protein DIPPA_00199 [Diplonema papillatum]|nr:hypothetical protein DIPPA_00199 [Diplonema papillatum]KAJ9462263.1 hypothetical protein DIPPA_00199 [Diplonema papillatum]